MSVDVAAIEEELAELWRGSSEGEQAVTRACLWNLVAHTVGPDGTDELRAQLNDVVAAVPARVLLLRVDPGGDEPPLASSVSVSCRMAGDGGKLLCSEEIDLEARHGGVVHLPALVRALLVPDVKTALWWAHAPPCDPAEVAPFLRGVDRLIVDTGHPDVASAVDLGALARLDRAVELADLGWLRLGPMRVLLASLFDPPVGADPLVRADRVRLVACAHGRATAMLLLGWIVDRLGWTPVRDGSGWTAERPGGRVRLEVEVTGGDAGRDGLFELAIESGADRFAITDAGPGRIEVTGAGLPHRVLAAPERPDRELLVAALGVRGRDPLFRLALARALALGVP